MDAVEAMPHPSRLGLPAQTADGVPLSRSGARGPLGARGRVAKPGPAGEGLAGPSRAEEGRLGRAWSEPSRREPWVGESLWVPNVKRVAGFRKVSSPRMMREAPGTSQRCWKAMLAAILGISWNINCCSYPRPAKMEAGVTLPVSGGAGVTLAKMGQRIGTRRPGRRSE